MPFKQFKISKPLKIWVMALLAGIVLLASACGSDSSDTASDSRCPVVNGTHILDKNNDGKVRIGIATPGPRDDGAYYQALVETAREISREQCFSDAIIVDNIKIAESETTLRNLATQDVDLIAVGSTDIAGSLEKLTEEFPEILWYCNCGSNFVELPKLIQSRDDSSEINYTAGVATGLLLRRASGSQVLFLGCCDLDFEQESFKAFEAGLQSINSDYEVKYIPTGAFPFDFNNVSTSVEALTSALGEVDAVYPFLGEAHEPVVQRANENDILTLSAGVSDVCERTDLSYDVAVRFDPGDYFNAILPEIISGEIGEGEIRRFAVGRDSEVGALICRPTAEETSELESVYLAIENGSLDQIFQKIKNEVYNG